jgi:hypothetical protein
MFQPSVDTMNIIGNVQYRLCFWFLNVFVPFAANPNTFLRSSDGSHFGGFNSVFVMFLLSNFRFHLQVSVKLESIKF